MQLVKIAVLATCLLASPGLSMTLNFLGKTQNTDPTCRTGILSLPLGNEAQVCCSSFCGECSDHEGCSRALEVDSDTTYECCKSKALERSCANGAPADVCLQSCSRNQPPCIMDAHKPLIPTTGIIDAGKDCNEALYDWRKRAEMALKNGKQMGKKMQEDMNPPTPVKDSYEHHFWAFGQHNVKEIEKDYTEESVVTVFNNVDGKMNEYTGPDAIGSMYKTMFKSLFDVNDMAAPVQDVEEGEEEKPGSVFLIWNCAKSGYEEATETFIFDKDGKIKTQNVVITYKDPREEKMTLTAVQPDIKPEGAGAVHSAYESYFSAFGAKDVEKISKDYTDMSVLTVYNEVTGKKTKYEGLDEIKERFGALFESLFDTSNFKAPVQQVKEGGEAFLIWSAGASGYKSGTDTFIFDADGKILEQNAVVHYEKPAEMIPKAR